MGRHIRRRDPRAHWILLLLGMTVVIAGLTLDGFARHGIGLSRTPHAPGPGATSALPDAGPVVRFTPQGFESRRMPARTIALTFDDGPDPRWTPRILDILRRHHAHATFFVLGSRVNEHPGLVRRIIAEGHEVGSHTFTHGEITGLPAWRLRLELTLTQNALAAATGMRTSLFRPPYSAIPEAVDGPVRAALRNVAGAGYLIVLTDLDSRDWARPGVDRVVATATPKAGAGAVVLMHDAGGDRTQTVEALDRLVPRLAGQGYRFTTVSEGLGLPRQHTKAAASTKLRGHAMALAQRGAGALTSVVTLFLVIAAGLALARLFLQVLCAWIWGLVRKRRYRKRGRPVFPPVSVIVPAYNEAANIAATVRSLVTSRYPMLDVIVVDDGSTDGTCGIVQRLRLPGVRVIRQPNAGKPAALNTGIAAAWHDILVLVDGDTVFEPDTVARLVQPFADPTVGAVAGNTKVGNRKGLLGRWQHLEYVTGFNLDRRLFEMAGCMPTIPGAIGAFRRRALIDAGGVSADTSAEDTDLTMALCRSGWRLTYEQSARAWTEAPGTLRQLWRQRYRWCYGTLQSMWKHRRSLVERGGGGRLGRRGLVYLLLFQLLLPLFAPAVDLIALYGLVFLDTTSVAAAWLGFLGAHMLVAGYALRLDRERLGPLWTMPLQQIVYRQLMYLVVVQSVVTAALGARLRWHRLHRTGQAGAALGTRLTYPSAGRRSPSRS